MTDSPCSRTPDLLAAARAPGERGAPFTRDGAPALGSRRALGTPDATELERHLAGCVPCRDALAVEAVLRHAAAAFAPALPAPAALRFRAARRRAELARARALAPLKLWKGMAALALAGTLAALGDELVPFVRLVTPVSAAFPATGAGLALFALLALAALAGLWLNAVEGAE